MTTTLAPAAADRSVDAATVHGEAFNRSGLTDVERLPLRHAAVAVDQADDPGSVPPGQRVRNEAAQLSGSNDGDLAHAVRYCNGGAGNRTAGTAAARRNVLCASGSAVNVRVMQSLIGKVAVVTGGSRGIGFAIAHALAAQGVKVTITGRTESHLAEARLRTRAPQPERRVETKRADVRRYADVELAIGAAARRFGGLDILVNNAGVGVFTDVAEMTPVQWAEVIDTNLTGVFNACHAALPHLRRRGSGFIINISSLAGKNPFAGAAAYCASKAGLNAFSEALMQEVRYDGIRVSYVMPGSVATGFSGGDSSKGDDWKIAPEEVAEVVINLLRHSPQPAASRVELRPSETTERVNENIHIRQAPRHARAPRNDDGHGARASGRRA